MRKIYIVLILISFCCSEKQKSCEITNESILKEQASKVFVTELNDGKIQDISDKGADSINEVGYYTFYNDGHLKSYKFFVTKEAFVYNEEYNQKGELIRIEGKPLVYFKGRNISKDSSVYTLYFSALNRNYDNLNVSINNKQNFSFRLLEDSTRSNMKYAFFGINTKALNEVNIYIKIIYKNECTGKEEILRDTFSLERSP